MQPTRLIPLPLHRCCFCFTITLLMLMVPIVNAGTWSSELEDGRTIHVDPRSNRPTIASGVGEGQPLWDGVHRLQDGSTITVRSGVMVPNRQFLQQDIRPQKNEAIAHTQVKRSPACDLLVLKVCGLQGDCESPDACGLARQLRASLGKPAAATPSEYKWIISQCELASKDETNFPTCASSIALINQPCQQLVDMLCVGSWRCTSSAACKTARLLLEQQSKEPNANGLNGNGGFRQQCRKMLLEHAFFPPCR